MERGALRGKASKDKKLARKKDNQDRTFSTLTRIPLGAPLGSIEGRPTSRPLAAWWRPRLGLLGRLAAEHPLSTTFIRVGCTSRRPACRPRRRGTGACPVGAFEVALSVTIFIVIRPVLDIAASFVAASPNGVIIALILQRGCPQLGGVRVTLRLVLLVLVTWGQRAICRLDRETLLRSQVVRRQEQI